MFQDLSSLVVDLGSSHSRIGYGGDDAPRLTPASYVSYYNGEMASEGQEYRVGDKSLWNDRENNSLLSIYERKGAEGYRFLYPVL